MQTLSPKQQEMLTDVSNMQGQYQAVDNQTGRALLRKKLIRQVFQSTLPLRGATILTARSRSAAAYFPPPSPCGE